MTASPPTGAGPWRTPRGPLPVGALIVLLTATACGDAGADRLTEVGDLIRDGSVTSTASVSDVHLSGGPTLSVEASFTGTVADTKDVLHRRLTAAGYILTCPGSRGDAAPPGQDDATDPRETCRVGGHGLDGTVWISTTLIDPVKVSAKVITR